MPCLGPLQAYYPAGDGGSSHGTGRLVFDKRKSHSGVGVKVPCGQCIECRLEYARGWAVRCVNEMRMWPDSGSSFLTLTYDNEHLPAGNTLVLDDLQRFMKRLRHVTGPSLRFYACGEYGETFGRPHYHVLLLNYAVKERKFHSRSKRGDAWYTSAELSRLWTAGHSLVGDVTFESCAYVTSYVAGKITGERAAAHYGGRCPEFSTMSSQPGLGSSYIQKYGAEVLRRGSVVLNGFEGKIPRFYDVKLSDNIDYGPFLPLDGSRLSQLKKKWRRAAMLHKSDHSSRRLRDREIVLRSKLGQKGKVL